MVVKISELMVCYAWLGYRVRNEPEDYLRSMNARSCSVADLVEDRSFLIRKVDVG
ncbi:MAG: hypothetical protein KF775_10885 [Cyclobacteriaceae bacterium]|nr:hypothetical protein [Cyclobacteriaceae bacterium]